MKKEILSFDDALKIAKGCHDYGGGYRDDKKYEIFHHGIQTVINALERTKSKGLKDLQSAVLYNSGKLDVEAMKQKLSESAIPEGYKLKKDLYFSYLQKGPLTLCVPVSFTKSVVSVLFFDYLEIEITVSELINKPMNINEQIKAELSSLIRIIRNEDWERLSPESIILKKKMLECFEKVEDLKL